MIFITIKNLSIVHCKTTALLINFICGNLIVGGDHYKDHAAIIYEHLKDYADECFLLTGEIPRKEQHRIRAEMDSVPDSKTMILVATGQLIGEGFDFPRLDTLIMATPVAWKGIVEQYAGRLNRDYPGKESVIIYDYVDAHIPVLDNMYAKRLKAYRQIGYQIAANAGKEKQAANAIYDSDSYLSVYEQDLSEAQNGIVISSPTLGRNKVYRFIRLLKDCIERGVRVTIVTWHPDAYRYGRDEARIELMELLRNSGFHLVLAQEHCEHYAVIDHKIVWYGSMKLLSRDDVDDNIMRVVSDDIATELLEMTFGSDDMPKEYSLPI